MRDLSLLELEVPQQLDLVGELDIPARVDAAEWA